MSLVYLLVVLFYQEHDTELNLSVRQKSSVLKLNGTSCTIPLILRVFRANSKCQCVSYKAAVVHEIYSVLSPGESLTRVISV